MAGGAPTPPTPPKDSSLPLQTLHILLGWVKSVGSHIVFKLKYETSFLHSSNPMNPGKTIFVVPVAITIPHDP